MIAFLEGQVKALTERFVIIQTGGIGFKVFISGQVLKSIPEQGADVKLWCHFYIREGIMELYGFNHVAEVEFFEYLIALPGIGPKSALGVLAVAPLDTLKRAVAAGEVGYLTKVSGIGKKTAEKIILELRDKMGKDLVSPYAKKALKDESDVLDALVSLGYSTRDVREVLQKIPSDTESINERIKEALKLLS